MKPFIVCRSAMVAASVLAFVVMAAAREPGQESGGRADPTVTAAQDLTASFQRAAEIARPCIVTIRTVGVGDDDAGTGSATGIVVDRAGWILTNFHNVDGADSLQVQLSDQSEYRVVEVLPDAWSDLALLRIQPAGDLPEARFGDSDHLELCDWVLTAGNSFGLGISVNQGTISATDRMLGTSNVPLLQTNAVSSPGNSGGPLLNLRGEVVGICEGAYGISGGFEGIAFAIPSNLARFVVKELLQHGSVRWPYLGAAYESLTPTTAKALGHSCARGAIITHVATGSPADKAGVRVGDVIVRFEDRPIVNAAALSVALQQCSVSERVEITVSRDGEIIRQPVRLGVRPSEIGLVGLTLPIGGFPEDSDAAPESQIGLALSNVDDDELCKRDFAPELSLKGVLVKRVTPHGVAHGAGIEAGTLITHVGTEPIDDLGTFRVAIQKRTGPIVLLVWCSCGTATFVSSCLFYARSANGPRGFSAGAWDARDVEGSERGRFGS